ncbi:hypothetical protein BG011_007879 [Mortierella polycephala]|uniref:RNA-dependent RNA polymerase n=1 Tax=Mortierella polycephala TaxID=41804 RepID=A0A9P6PP60_9FUNG|nr:hypothetical protein BG011_007879 [Mortierella polycephala]
MYRTKLERDIMAREDYETMWLRINNLDDQVNASAVRQIMMKFGTVGEVTVEKSEKKALIKFDSKPYNVQGLLNASLGGRMLDLELLERKADNRFALVSAESLELGFKLAQDKYCREFTATLNVVARFQEYRRTIKLTFERPFKDTTVEYQIDMNFQDMSQGCIEVESLPERSVITIQLQFPPRFWRFDPDIGGKDPTKWSTNTCLRRVVDIPPEGSIFANKAPRTDVPLELPPIEPNPTNVSAKLGKWTVIRMVVNNRASQASLGRFVRKCKAYNLLASNPGRLTVLDSSQLVRPRLGALQSLAFDVQYLLEAALSHNYIVEYDLTAEVVKLLSGLNPLVACSIVDHIIALRKRVWNLQEYLIQEISKLTKTSLRPRIVPHQCVYLRKVLVTPTTMHLQPPTIETSNRIIRHFSYLSDYFLRVEFSDEGHNKLWSKDGSQNLNNAIYNRIFSALTSGIKIGDRTYEFLAYSASQLRDNAAWFFCPQGGDCTADSIRDWMGDFSHIKSIAKYGARMGQCFSSTRAIANLAASEVEMIDDIEHNGHNFSDGCGRLSSNLAQIIGLELEKEVTPAAFQIRLGGSKGVLVTYPNLVGRKVQIRPSMKKFDVAHYVLEVIKTSSFIPSYLNRQIINLLSALGVPDSVFMVLKNQMVRDLERVESDETTALKMLIQNWDEGGTSNMMMSMIRAGFMQREDPFLKNLLTLFKLQMLEQLSKKARIFVPKGAYLLGVCDETGVLAEGEIFVQVSSVENPNKRRIIEGKCVVVRCPCFHPGDIRVVRAVNRPALMHMYDVVAFNTKGHRGIPSMCSGGDLDGDDFTVIWDPDIVNKVKEHSPMDYAGHAAQMNDYVTIHDSKKFFVQYAVSNNLGLIAHAHLALSDKLEDGPLHGKCIRLAQLHSDAVDFPKSGKHAELTPELRPRDYPDFMEKTPDRTYRSERIIARIYRDCGRLDSFKPKDYSQSFNKDLLVEGYEEYLEDAQRCKTTYDDEVRSLMNQYGVRSELEIASGYVIAFDILTNKKEHDVRNAINISFSAIKKWFRTELEREFYSPDSKMVSPIYQTDIERKASAWYAVSYQDLGSGEPYTFAWIAWEYLCKIAMRVSASSLRPMITNGSEASVSVLTTPKVDLIPKRQMAIIQQREEPKVPKNKVRHQAGFLTVEPDVDDETLFSALGLN